MQQPATGRQNDKLSLALLAAGAASFIALLILLGLIIFTDTFDGTGGNSLKGTVTAFEVPPEPTPTPLPEPPSRAPIARLMIPRFDVDAPVQEKGIDANNVMEAPDGPENVAWYKFTARPGFGNAVFSGHVDYINYGPAVFANVRNLEPNDIIEVRLEDGTRFRYKVSSKELVPADTDVSAIVGPSEDEIITLITCEGTFNTSTGQYSDRLIVQARLARVFPTASSATAP